MACSRCNSIAPRSRSSATVWCRLNSLPARQAAGRVTGGWPSKPKRRPAAGRRMLLPSAAAKSTTDCLRRIGDADGCPERQRRHPSPKDCRSRPLPVKPSSVGGCRLRPWTKSSDQLATQRIQASPAKKTARTSTSLTKIQKSSARSKATSCLSVFPDDCA